MNKPQSARRGRGRNPKRSKPGNGVRGDFRAKGNPKQLLDKYKSLARDSLQSGDRVLAENYFQHADHYQRVLNERNGLAAGVYEDPNETGDGDAGGNDEAQMPRRRRSRSQRREEAAADEQTQPAVDVDDPRRRGTSGDGEENSADASKTSPADVRRPRRPRRAAKSADTDMPDTARDTAAE